MAPKAHHLRSGVNHQSISVDRLFNAAFGPSAAHYRKESLMGWRPVSTSQLAMPDQEQERHPLMKEASRNQSPDVHIQETPEHIQVEVELPIIKADSLYLEIAGDLLIIRGERMLEHRPGSRQTAKGPMVHRYVQLPIIARPGEVRARLDGNTLRVRISKQPNVG